MTKKKKDNMETDMFHYIDNIFRIDLLFCRQKSIYDKGDNHVTFWVGFFCLKTYQLVIGYLMQKFDLVVNV